MKHIGCLLAILISQSVFAAVPAQKVKPTPSKILAGEGVSYGGLAGSGFTLLDVRRTADAKKKVERIVIDIGDASGSVMKGLPGFYYAELKRNPQRLVIDFSQMPNARLTKAQITQRLAGSKSIVKTDMSLDPLDNALNLTLDLKRNTKVRVYQVAGAKTTSKVVIDLISQ